MVGGFQRRSGDPGWMEDKYQHQQRGCSTSAPGSEPDINLRSASSQLLQLPSEENMNCGFLCFLFLGLWAELVTVQALPINAGMRSIAEDLLKVLQSYSSELKKTKLLKDLHHLKCNETAVQWNKTSMMANRLLQKQTCAEKLQPFSPEVDICPLITLNQDLLQHLNESGPDSSDCPTSSFNSPPTPNFNFLTKSMQCIDCWSQQVAALLT
ncbi:hypothetical protein ILYODFUR_013420 [Ilyodon furcidens]|uniref:Uncharacterized protein n=1 Tax=Ilyodon furcidens TaxID=33524 RepID=A0ABV0T7N9_9TELE